MSEYLNVYSENQNLKELYQSMNRVNQQIQRLKIENRQQEQYFQILIEHLAIGILTYNKHGFIQHANSSAKKIRMPMQYQTGMPINIPFA